MALERSEGFDLSALGLGVTSQPRPWVWPGVHKPERISSIFSQRDEEMNAVLLGERGRTLINDQGIKKFYEKGKLHRVDGPAIELADGTTLWFLNGKLHREDGAAIEWAGGAKEWWIDDKEVQTRTSLTIALGELKKVSF
jgi:hypothetical protein